LKLYFLFKFVELFDILFSSFNEEIFFKYEVFICLGLHRAYNILFINEKLNKDRNYKCLKGLKKEKYF